MQTSLSDRELIDTLWNVNGDNVFTYEADERPN